MKFMLSLPYEMLEIFLNCLKLHFLFLHIHNNSKQRGSNYNSKHVVAIIQSHISFLTLSLSVLPCIFLYYFFLHLDF